MSRIGNKPISVPQGVEVAFENNTLTVQGPKGTLAQSIDPSISVVLEDGILRLSRSTNQKRHKALHGLYRSLAQNMITGVSEGYTVQLELVGVGYKATHQGQVLDLSLGYSHTIMMQLPEEISLHTEMPKGRGGITNPIITLQSHDKQLIGQVAGKLKALRKTEPYKGKGIRHLGEQVRMKPGKSAKKV